MRYSLAIVALLVMAGYGYSQVSTKSTRSGDASGQRQLVMSADHPKQTVALEAVAKFRLASVKRSYHVGETIIVGAAMLNDSSEPVFFPNFFDIQWAIRYENRDPEPLLRFGLAEQVLTPKSYVLLKSGFIQSLSLQFFVGCEEEYFLKARNSGVEDKDERLIFETDGYLYKGQGCINIQRPGSYTITAQVSNDRVVVDSSNIRVKTAVGTITSVPLVIKVIAE